MTTPPRIWLQWYGDDLPSPDEPDHTDVTWSPDRIYGGDIEYIRADLVEPRPAVTCPYWRGGQPIDADCPHPDGATGAHCPYCAEAGECSALRSGVCVTCGRVSLEKGGCRND